MRNGKGLFFPSLLDILLGGEDGVQCFLSFIPFGATQDSASASATLPSVCVILRVRKAPVDVMGQALGTQRRGQRELGAPAGGGNSDARSHCHR